MRPNIVWRCTCHILRKYFMGRFCDMLNLAFSIYVMLVWFCTYYNGRYSVKVVPILVGAVSAENEAMYGELLAKYVDDPNNFFSVSSDFCHWGSRYVSWSHFWSFQYRYRMRYLFVFLSWQSRMVITVYATSHISTCALIIFSIACAHPLSLLVFWKCSPSFLSITIVHFSSGHWFYF